MPFFGAKSKMAECETRLVKSSIVGAYEWMRKLRPLFHRSIHRRALQEQKIANQSKIEVMRAAAIKKGSREKTLGFQEMGTLRCDGCGEEFFIGHRPQSADKRVAEQQAKWLEKVLADEHERDRKHSDRIELPD